MAESEQLLTQARDAESLDAMGDFKWDGMHIPVMGCTSRVPNIPGIDSSEMDKLPNQMKGWRRALHITTDTNSVLHVQALFETAKARGLVEPLWGRNCHPSAALVKKK